ncbi:MAG: glycoside hydrolase family 9 protein [Oscillospiraceae bacterium]|nr:glycoside hydrolase family 9 protein [Oscillospiraceae bacterium]
MKKHTVSALTLALCLLNSGTSAAQIAVSATDETLTYGILSYQAENGGITITGCDAKAASVEIPSEIDGIPVTKIGATAFYGCALTSVVIPEGVTEIASGAFWHSKSLTEVSLPSTLTTIERFAFNDCPALISISFPESLTTIGNNAFTDTAWLTQQKAESPFVTANHILIDASATVTNVLDELTAEKERRAQAIEDAKNWERAGILTNQEGYFPNLDKKATLLSDAPSGVAFELLDENGNAVYSGISQPKGLDADSGDMVHVLDFSDFTTEGTYTLKAETGETSREFRIGVLDIYSGLVYDALNYFYQNRSGIEIEEQYITSGNPSELARAAGHVSDIAEIQRIWGYPTSGTQDVSGGWYDAGDHGKYVVNGGISLWLMQNQYERAHLNGTDEAYQDGAMKIPENGNGIADLLDESRYEMEWMLKMIVQDGDYQGMAYHKVHDIKWTALATAPAEDTMSRILIPPTTAATLNLAACGAQAYRLWKDIDPDFAEACLTAAENAYTAAKAHPEMYASSVEYGGGGAYGDDVVTDEFYWAACELYTSTGKETYYADLQNSDFAFAIPSDLSGGEADNLTGSFDWGHTAALGSMTLLLHDDILSAQENQKLKSNLTETADYYLYLEENQGYGLPYEANPDGGYVWASNSFVSDNAIILAYAYDENQESKYLNGIVSAADYLLGRNAMDYSYVTGYGVHSAQYPHHRWWAKSVDSAYPKAPCGVLVGGANTGREDSVVKTAWDGLEVPPQKAYLNDIQAYSVNECAVNWNSSLAWTISYLCEQNGGIQTGQASGGIQIPELPRPEDVETPEFIITVPDGITGIGEQIFGKYNSYVNEVILPDGVKKIGVQAFSGCKNLERLNIPTSVESVGEKAFAETPWLAEVQADSPLLIINGLLIDGNAAKGDVIIPEGVTSILGNAFYMNTEITSVSIPEGVQNIGANAFDGCEALTDLTLPESLKTIKEKAFSGIAVTELTIPAGVTEIGDEAFINCKSLPEVTVLGADTKIGEKAFGWTSTFTATGQYSYIFVYHVIEDFSVICNQKSSADSDVSDAGVKKAYFGDTDGDGDVSILDVITINRAILGKEKLTSVQQKTADVNHSGAPDSGDCLSVMKYIVGLLTSF